jgi:hypothetical protein
MSIGGLGGAGGEVGPAHTHLTAGSARSSAADAGAAQVFVPLEAARAPFYPDTSPTGMRSTTFAVATRLVVQPPHCRHLTHLPSARVVVELAR